MKNWDVVLLEYTSNIYWIIGIFIFFTLLLHLLFVLWFPLSLKTWKLVDYLWLSLALLSTLGLVGNAKQFRAQNFYAHSEAAVIQSLGNVRNWYTDYQIFICSKATSLKEKNLNAIPYDNLCDWLERQINDLNLLQQEEKNSPELFPSMTAGLRQYSTIITPPEQKILMLRVTQYNKKRTLYLDNIAEKKKTPLQILILIIAPILLAFALALRFTKVTAEYRLFDTIKNKVKSPSL